MSSFFIETGAMRLVWGPGRGTPPSAPHGAVTLPSLPVVEALHPDVRPRVGGTPAYLVEQTAYTLLVQSRQGEPVAVRHRDPVLLQGLHTAEGGRLVHGTLNFGSQVGYSRFVVEIGGRPHVALTVEVYPTKLDYRDDYEALRAEVQALARELAYAYLRATYRPAAGSTTAEKAGTLGWLVMLQGIAADLERALGEVARRPRPDTARRVAPVRAERLQRVDAAVRRAVAQVGPEAVAARRSLPSQQAVYSLDTPEHRWLAAQLRSVRARVARLTAAERRRPEGLRQARIAAELAALGARVDRWLAAAPLAGAGTTPPPAPTQRLLMAPGYREAYRGCLALRRGLTLGGGPLALSLKDLHQLYEYWCFLTTVRLTAEVTGHPWPVRALLAVEQDGLHLRLRKGQTQTVSFDLGCGRTLALTYNPRFAGRGYLVPQQPDIVLTVAEAGAVQARFILDAKYRLDASPGYVRRYGLPGPPVEALNTLHRYRDAIREREGGRRTVVQAVALYPYRPPSIEAVAEGRHTRALHEVGVGALPLLPGVTAPLRRWLATLC